MSFNSKTNCWICLRPYDDHTEEDWNKCSIANMERGRVIERLGKLVGETDQNKEQSLNVI